MLHCHVCLSYMVSNKFKLRSKLSRFWQKGPKNNNKININYVKLTVGLNQEFPAP